MAGIEEKQGEELPVPSPDLQHDFSQGHSEGPGLQHSPPHQEDEEEENEDELKDLQPTEEHLEGVLDEDTVAEGLHKLGRSAPGTEYVYLNLSLSGRELSDINILSRYIHLQKLELSYNKINDLSCVSQMPYLLELNASNNELTTYFNFKPPKNLKEVDFSHNQIPKMRDLSAYQSLTKLLLDFNNIEEIRGLEKCHSLTHLSLSHNRLTAISGLENLPIRILNLVSKLDAQLVELLQAVLCSPKCPEQIQLLCAAILREMAPCDGLRLSCHRIHDTKLLSLVSSVLLAQGEEKAAVSAVGQRIVKALEGRLPEGQSSRYLLPILSNVISLSPEALTEEQINVVSKKMADWLRYASTQQGVAQPSGGFFSNPRTRQPGPVTEVDGAIATDFFTVLSLGQHYTEDQCLNMQTFSMLRKWLLCYGGKERNTPNSGDKSEMDRSVMSVVSTSSTSSRLLPPKERLREKAFEYCQRLVEQSNRQALKKADGDLQKACLIEAVTIMDIICKQDSSYVYRAASFLKILHGRISGDATYARALLPIAQFFLNHGEMAAVDSDAIYKHLFTDIPAQLFHNSSLAFEFVLFCKDNSQLFTATSSIFRQSFPNLFKFLAWNSPPLIAEFVDILPFLLDAGTAIEIFHLLLDLPCLTAALDVQMRSSSLPSAERAACDPAVKPTACLEAFRNPLYRSAFQYLLRVESVSEDFQERVIPLRQLLGSLASSPRVMHCADTVPVLLELFFSVVAEFADASLINQLVVLVLQRSDQLYEIPAFKDDVHRVLSSQLVMLCKLRPALVVELSKELLEFSGTVSNIQNKEPIFTHLVWAIGEYMSVSYDKRCTVEQINRFFETLEAVLFEVTQVRPQASVPNYAPRAITVLMTALTKLAARSQDLIPRVSLFLSKMRTFVQSPAVTSVYCEEDREEILTRATELMNLLKMPSVAQFVFTPSVDVARTRLQKEVNDTLPSALRIVTRLLEPAPGFVPG